LLAHGDALLLDTLQRECASPAKRFGRQGRLDAGQRGDSGRYNKRLRGQLPVERGRRRQGNRLHGTRHIHPHAHLLAALARRKQQCEEK
jgi:hypothetical protein